MILVYPFTTEQTPNLEQVGGKGMSLIFMKQRNLPVPPGFVLTVDFFEPWLKYLKSLTEWEKTLNQYPDNLKDNCYVLKSWCRGLQLNDKQNEALSIALETLKSKNGNPLFAVRSSSPEEDLEQASFAGGYVTSLGVKEDGVLEAIRLSFTSLFDELVFVYKQSHGFPIEEPRIAVIVMQQLPAQTSGVAFSLNPLNNSYDEAIINANFGLGESVVSGAISPDQFVVDKITGEILDRKIGSKETAIWLDSDGGTFEKPAEQSSQLCISDHKVAEVTELLTLVESIYQKPIDIEWAYTNGDLYLLQARPITAYFPLPQALLTPPGAQKQLYGDLTLIKWGMQEPVSVMGTDYLALANTKSMQATMGKNLSPEAVNAMRITTEGRTYTVMSNAIKMMGKERQVNLHQSMDPLSAEIVANLDESEYIPPKLPASLRGILLKAVAQNIGKVGGVIKGLRNPAAQKQRYLDEEVRLRNLLSEDMEKGPSLKEFAEASMDRMMTYVDTFYPTFAVAEMARSRIKKIFKDDPPEIQEQVVYLERALPNNITIKMGLEMYKLASFDGIKTCQSGKEFSTRLAEGTFSTEFMDAWGTFLEDFGFRCPMEMDPATPRPYEHPEKLFEQLHIMAENTDLANNPQAIFENAQSQRQETYERLLSVAQKKGKGKVKQFEKNYRILVDLGGFRESPKYHLVLATDIFRRYVLEAAKPLVAAGRLDHPSQAFDLTMDELDRGIADPSIDLKALAYDNTTYLRRFDHIREFPRMVDSRGKILRPPRKEPQDGEFQGEPISPGVVKGQIKILHEPDQKPVFPGEILVARATDPGWTPLFLNAAGIVLEIGGMLQHGALVAREYGKPCVAGIENATEVFKDGQMVEMDGTSGIITLVPA
jgi:phosphohistidine swiveling domain-containing protein